MIQKFRLSVLCSLLLTIGSLVVRTPAQAQQSAPGWM